MKRQLLAALALWSTLCLSACQTPSPVAPDSVISDTTSNYVDSSTPGATDYTGYYSSINTSMRGQTLKNALYQIISRNTRVIAYDNLYSAMRLTDRDWTLSPNESDQNPYMNLIYGSYNHQTSTAKRYDDYPNIWDKEHIWAKAHGINRETTSNPAYSDLHHLRASDKNNNNRRGNLDFDTILSGGNPISDASGQDSGTIKGSYYMPLAEFRGDVARAMFYMATRYSQGSVILTLINSPTGTSAFGSGSFGILSTLLTWHVEDPVDEFETRRNELIYTRYQNNRNPYIDHPEFAQWVFAS